MASCNEDVTRRSSSASSTPSNVNDLDSGDYQQDRSSTEASASRDEVSTPPTSMGDGSNDGSANGVGEQLGRRSKRHAKASDGSYNLKERSTAQQSLDMISVKAGRVQSGNSRNVSGLTGETLVDFDRTENGLASKVDKESAMDIDTPQPSPAKRQSSQQLGRRPSVKEKVMKMAGKVGSVGSVLGKRSREIMDRGKDKLRRRNDNGESPKQERLLKQLDTGSKGLLDEIDLDAEPEFRVERPRKKLKTKGMESTSLAEIKQSVVPSNPSQRTSNGKSVKKWQTAGLYAGQSTDFDSMKPGGGRRLQKRKQVEIDSSAGSTPSAKRLNMGLPMFSYLERERFFKIPYDVFAPSVKKGDQRPKDWHQLNRNRLIGDAKDMWTKEEKLARSVCMCTEPNEGEEGCGDQCLNRSMEYECNDENCNLTDLQCSNRAFSELAVRNKKGGPYDIGVEVVKTSNRGFGVRACRSFRSGQIVMEYTGEIITEEECQRRMHEVYKDKSNFYLMEMERGTHIDGTKGSMARFINHCCAPNCTVRLMKVNGIPRMGVFAGDQGITTGEELTYDYNFDNFGESRQQCFCGAPTCRGYLGKKLSAAEQKKRDREESERKQRAAVEAQKAAEERLKAKKTKAEQDKAGWRGWVNLNDPETRKRIKAEQELKKAAEMHSDRARRAAARRGSMPPPARPSPTAKGKSNVLKATRRRTTAFEKADPRKASDSSQRAFLSSELEDGGEINIDVVHPPASPRPSTSDTVPRKHRRNTSTGSKFTEDLPRSASKVSVTSVVTRTELTVTEELSTVEKGNASPELNEKAAVTSGTGVSGGPEVEGYLELADSESGRSHNVNTVSNDTVVATDGPGGVARKRSILKTVGSALNRAVKSGISKTQPVVGSGGMKQSTLKFSKLS